MIKYLGSKRKLVGRIGDVIDDLDDVTTVMDIFTGTTRVAQELKRRGYVVAANDMAAYSHCLAQAYVAADAEAVDTQYLATAIDQLNALDGIDGFITKTYARSAQFFQEKNTRRVDAIRPAIETIARDATERAILLTSLMEAADRVDSTTGVQMAYLKSWAKRSYNDLELRMPALLTGTGSAFNLDANQLARTMAPVNVCYIDPPYNQHSYRSNYHIWETLVVGDEPEVYGKAMKRVDCREVKSDYNSKVRANSALADLVATIPARYLVISFSDEGYLSRTDMETMLAPLGSLTTHEIEHDRYVGARIGIHNLKGEKVGTVSHTKNTEYIYVLERQQSSDGTISIARANTPT